MYSIFLELNAHRSKNLAESFLTTNKPVNPDVVGEDVDKVDMEIYRQEVKQFVRLKTTLQRNLEKSYGLIWGQCSAGLQTYLCSLTSHQLR